MEVPLLVGDFLRRAAKLYPNKTAIVDGDSRYTYAQFRDRVNQMARLLQKLGVKPGERICILSPNSHYFLESYYAVPQVGAILVLLNYRLLAEDIEYMISHAGVRTMLVDWGSVDVIDGLRPNLPGVLDFISAEDGGSPKDGWHDWDQLIANESTAVTPELQIAEHDICSINYTFGTTARPKGVMLTHRNAYNFIAHARITHEDVEMWTLPMFHANGWGGPYALTATHAVLRAVVAEDIFNLIEAEKVTFASMAPAVRNTILGYEDGAKYNTTTRPRFMVAGAPAPAAFIQHLEEELGWESMQIYGLTETSPIVTVSLPDYHNQDGKDYERRARVGVEAIGVHIQIFDDDGNAVPMDGETVGEICARSNVIIKGYWEQPEVTEKEIVDGYFRTGGLAVWDEFANVNIVDRKKDIIISGGENVSSAEVEAALYQHEGVLECAVIGVPSEKWGETPKALVVMRDGMSSTEEDMIAFTRHHLAHFKCPTSIDFVDALPRTVTGKLQKFVLRDRYWAGQKRRVN